MYTAFGPLLAVAASVLWAIHLAFANTALSPSSAGLAGVSVLVATAIVAVAWLAAGSRWARYGVLAVVASHGALALYGETGPIWWAALVTSSIAAVTAVLWPPQPADDRQRPPWRATGLALGMVATPLIVALSNPAGVPLSGWVWAGASAVLAWRYSQADRWALWATRIAWPLVGVGVAVESSSFGGSVAAVVLVLAVSVLAWHSESSLALEQPRRVETVRMPPELVPGDLLEAAGLDERGRKRTSDDAT